MHTLLVCVCVCWFLYAWSVPSLRFLIAVFWQIWTDTLCKLHSYCNRGFFSHYLDICTSDTTHLTTWFAGYCVQHVVSDTGYTGSSWDTVSYLKLQHATFLFKYHFSKKSHAEVLSTRLWSQTHTISLANNFWLCTGYGYKNGCNRQQINIVLRRFSFNLVNTNSKICLDQCRYRLCGLTEDSSTNKSESRLCWSEL